MAHAEPDLLRQAAAAAAYAASCQRDLDEFRAARRAVRGVDEGGSSEEEEEPAAEEAPAEKAATGAAAVLAAHHDIGREAALILASAHQLAPAIRAGLIAGEGGADGKVALALDGLATSVREIVACVREGGGGGGAGEPAQYADLLVPTALKISGRVTRMGWRDQWLLWDKGIPYVDIEGVEPGDRCPPLKCCLDPADLVWRRNSGSSADAANKSNMSKAVLIGTFMGRVVEWHMGRGTVRGAAVDAMINLFE